MADGDVKTFKIKQTADPYSEWNPEFTVEEDLSRTGTGYPYTLYMIQDWEGTCEDPGYYFRWVPIYQMILDTNPISISVEGGVSPFSWSVAEDGFTLGAVSTVGRSNTISLVYPATLGDVGTVTVTDACSNPITGISNSTAGQVVGWYATTIPPPTYIIYGCGNNTNYALGAESGSTYFNSIVPVIGLDPSTIFLAGYNRSFSIQEDGTLWGTGSGTNGELGLGINNSSNHWVQLDSEIWTYIAGGQSFTIGIREDNTLWGTGSNYYGQLGMTDVVSGVGIFTEISGVTWGGGVTSVGTSWYNSIIAAYTGIGVYGTGRNEYGALGLGDQWVKYEFTSISIYPFEQMAGGANHIFGIISDDYYATDGTLWAAGRNNAGQLGLEDTTSLSEFTRISAETWLKVACGNGFTVAIKGDGSLWGTGYNGYGQLGLGDRTIRRELTQISALEWTDVSCGTGHTLVLKADGTIWGCGLNNQYQLGQGYGDTENRLSLIQLIEGDDWAAVSAGDNHSLFHKTI